MDVPRHAAQVRGMSRKKLIVEERAAELVSEVALLLKQIRYPCKASKDLEKSADSAYLNTGEGTAVFEPRKKAAKYDIARGEAQEVQRALDALVRKGKLTEAQIKRAYGLADEVIAMLTTMIKNLEKKF